MKRAARRPTTERASPGPQPELTANQRRAIHAQRRTLGIDDATWRQIVAEYPVEIDPHGTRPQGLPDLGEPCASAAHLSRRQARQVITRLELGGAPVGRPYSSSKRQAEDAEANGATVLASPAQRALIERLAAEITWRVNYSAWLHSRTSPTRGKPVQTYQHAEAVIEALHAMRDREAARP